jgi:hypothetical protein
VPASGISDRLGLRRILIGPVLTLVVDREATRSMILGEYRDPAPDA